MHSPVVPSDFERLVSGYRLIETALVGDPCCTAGYSNEQQFVECLRFGRFFNKNLISVVVCARTEVSPCGVCHKYAFEIELLFSNLSGKRTDG